jgi:TatD DNase family protein
MQLIDSHTHLDFSEFDADRSETIARAIDKGVSSIIVSATTANRWQLIKNLVLGYPAVCHAAVGLHPMFMHEHKNDHLDRLKLWLENNAVVAVGEIGLDFFIPEHDKHAQIELFTSQLKIAVEFNLPVIIHARKSLDVVLKHLRQHPTLRGSVHSFSGSEQQARQLIDLGFYLGFGGPISYTRATRLRKLVAELPLNVLLLETDSPDQADALHRGERNEPAYLINVAAVIAELRDISIKQVATVTSNNAKKLFKL